MRMYRVAICENELVQAQFLQKILEEYAQKQEIRLFSVSTHPLRNAQGKRL